ncbi:uncharacterized protein LOC109503697 [Harpegnathos saltator]|uniref:uncharacterized protein LOC109503697 n=1 Tax=Harpegnathos saltator TaxID=610380 RepID=UPI000DBEDB98|nr:uncharacterized protein LOC109503697 [Harpegnathos saltator]
MYYIHNLETVTILKPSAEYNRRAAIIESVRAGRSATEIIRFFIYPRSAVYDVVAKYNESEKSNEGFATPARKTHSKERVVRTPEIIQRAQELIFVDPGQSIRKLLSVVGVSEKTIRRIVEEDLRYKSHTIKVRQMLSEVGRTKTKFPANVHVLSVTSSEGDVMPPHSFNKGGNVTKEVYLHVLINVVKPWIETVSSGKLYVFQQNSAPRTQIIWCKIGCRTTWTCFGPKNFGLPTAQI